MSMDLLAGQRVLPVSDIRSRPCFCCVYYGVFTCKTCDATPKKCLQLGYQSQLD